MFIEDKKFQKIDFNKEKLQKGDYECCSFADCDLSNLNLSEYNFIECEFTNCNLSLVKLLKTSFRDVVFKGCKMLGLHFEDCSETGFAATFADCNLSHSSFYKRKLKKQVFKNIVFHESDFSECDLSNCIFNNCDLKNANFDNTNLENVDFRNSINVSIDPEKNNMKKAKFNLAQLPGLLEKYGLEID